MADEARTWARLPLFLLLASLVLSGIRLSTEWLAEAGRLLSRLLSRPDGAGGLASPGGPMGGGPSAGEGAIK